jgi:uncharacterized protein with FMN-binding domain
VRTRAVLGSILGSVTVLVVGWQAGAAAAHNAAETSISAAPTSTGSSSRSPSTSTSTPSATATPSTGSGSSSAGAAGTYAGSIVQTRFGSIVQTRFGPVQVEIVVAGGKVTDVKALQLTDQGGRSVQISNHAAPILRKEVLVAQSAKVSSVGGATYTTEGYLGSLQSALDKANL